MTLSFRTRRAGGIGNTVGKRYDSCRCGSSGHWAGILLALVIAILRTISRAASANYMSVEKAELSRGLVPRFLLFKFCSSEQGHVSYNRLEYSDQTKMSFSVHSLKSGCSYWNFGSLSEALAVHQGPCSYCWNVLLLTVRAALEADTMKIYDTNRSISQRKMS